MFASLRAARKSCTLSRARTSSLIRSRAPETFPTRNTIDRYPLSTRRRRTIEYSSRRRCCERISRVYICTYGRHISCVCTRIPHGTHSPESYAGGAGKGGRRDGSLDDVVRHVPGEQIDNVVHVTRTPASGHLSRRYIPRFYLSFFFFHACNAKCWKQR